MDEWYKIVRSLKSDSEIPYNTQRFVNKVFHDLSMMKKKVRDKGKFKNRMGPEFENWVAGLANEFGSDLINAIIGDDEFWEKTLELTLGV